MGDERYAGHGGMESSCVGNGNPSLSGTTKNGASDADRVGVEREINRTGEER